MSAGDLLTGLEVQVQFGLGEDFISLWTKPAAAKDYKEGRSLIPGMPVIRPGTRGALYPRALLMEWLLRYFGSGYGTGDETVNHQPGGKR